MQSVRKRGSPDVWPGMANRMPARGRPGPAGRAIGETPASVLRIVSF